MMRKVFEEFPMEKKYVMNGDVYITSYLGLYGKGVIFNDIMGSVSRKNNESSWTPMPTIRKVTELVNTFMWIYKLHNYHGRKDIAHFFKRRALTQFLNLYNTGDICECEDKFKYMLIICKAQEEFGPYFRNFDLVVTLKKLANITQSVGLKSTSYNILLILRRLRPLDPMVVTKLNMMQKTLLVDSLSCTKIELKIMLEENLNELTYTGNVTDMLRDLSGFVNREFTGASPIYLDSLL
jgi:hypothetical protein